MYGQCQDQHVLLCPPGRLWGILQGTSAFNSSKCELLLNFHRSSEALRTEAPGISRGFGFTGADYCLLSDHGCEYSCVNTDKSFACQCPEGHVLRSDGKTCASKCDRSRVRSWDRQDSAQALVGASGRRPFIPECPLRLDWGPGNMCACISKPDFLSHAPGNGLCGLHTLPHHHYETGPRSWHVAVV